MARRVVDHPLHVDAAIRGAELASPLRRFIAIAIDAAILVPPTIAVALLVAGLSLRVNDPTAYHAIRTMLSGHGETPEVWRGLLPILVRNEAPGLPASAVAAYEEGRVEEAVAALHDYDLNIALNLEEGGEARKRGERTILLQVEKLIPLPIRAASLFGIPALYFTVLLVVAGGATPGKWIAGIRVRRLDAHQLTLFESFERFVGYIHIPAMLGLPVLDLWRDPNRRMPHDRTVHTVVLRHRRVAAPSKKPAARPAVSA
jgi:uncharacterized RDD family membrane protein YckC